MAQNFKCTVCEGTGKQTITVETFGSPEKTHSYESECLWCKGSGKLNQKTKDELDYYNNLWCECGEEHGSTFFKDGEHPDMRKHHYRCNDCKKVTQIG